jgi:hypothetical protein
LSLAAWTFLQVMALLGGGEVGLIERLVPMVSAKRSILIEGQNVEVPATFFEYGAYGMAIGLVSIVATMANAMVRSGAALLRSDLRRLREEVLTAIRSEKR